MYRKYFCRYFINILTVLKMTSGLNSLLFSSFQKVEFILSMNVFSVGIISVGFTLIVRWPQNDSKYKISINFIASINESVNKKKTNTRKFSGVAEYEKSKIHESKMYAIALCTQYIVILEWKLLFLLSIIFVNWKKK